MLLDNIRNAFRSIASAKLRSFLTMLGIIIGVYAVLTMISIGDGVKKEVTSQISDLGTNILTVTSGQILKTDSNPNQKSSSPSFNFAGSAGSSNLTETDVITVRNTQNVVNVAEVSLISSNVAAGENTTSSAFVMATKPSYGSIRNLKIAEGEFLSDQDERNAARVVVLGGVTRETLFGKGVSVVGQQVLIRNQPFTIIGVLAKEESGLSLGASFDDVVYLPYSTGVTLTQTPQIYRILVQVNDAAVIADTKNLITQGIQTNHGGQTDFSVLSQDDLVGAFSTILDILTSFVIAIASISLLVGGIGIMNIMLVSVSERTREIGIRKAIGATGPNILWQFLIESITISLIGGIIGLSLAFANRWPLQKYAKITPVFSPEAILLAFGVAFGIGVIFGVVPALKASRKHPIQALKAI